MPKPQLATENNVTTAWYLAYWNRIGRQLKLKSIVSKHSINKPIGTRKASLTLEDHQAGLESRIRLLSLTDLCIELLADAAGDGRAVNLRSSHVDSA